MKNIIISGGTGLIGSALSSYLSSMGMEVAVLSRSKNKTLPQKVFQWSPVDGYIDPEAMEWADAVINLAGESLASGIWTPAKKKRLRDSRIKSTELLVKAIAKAEHPPQKMVSASAIGYYGDGGEQVLTEDSDPGSGFMAQLCVDWEAAASEVKKQGLSLAIVRIGIVLSGEGGFLDPLKKLTSWGVGGYFDSGQQYLPWIHMDDLVQVFYLALKSPEKELVVNGVGSSPVIFKEMLKQIGNALDKSPLLIPTPSFLVKPILGDMSEMFLNSARVKSRVLIEENFEYKYADLDKALASVVESTVS